MSFIRLNNEITTAILIGQKDITIGQTVCILPAPQKSGTYTQRLSYAADKAKTILSQLGITINNN
jgi:hypothetical protein